MRFTGGLKPFNNSTLRIAAREATVITFLQSGVLARTDLGQAISSSLTATANNGTTVGFAVVSGALPAGVTLNPVTGLVSGIPTAVGMYGFTIRATAGRTFKDQSFSITTNPVTVAWTTPAGSLGSLNGGHVAPMKTVLATASNDQPITYSIVSGTLPLGMVLSASGAITGTPTNLASTTSFTIRASYAGLVSVDRAFSLDVIADAVTWATPAGSLGALAGGDAFNYALSATCSAGDPITYSLVSGTLPTGATLSGGRIAGTTTNVGGTYSFTIRASDGLTFADRVFTISVAQDTITWATQGGSLGSFGGGAAFSKALSATSSTGKAVTYAIQTGTTPGLTITGSTLAGTITNLSQSYSFTIRASDGVTFSDLSFTLTTIADTITWTTTSLPLANQNLAYAQSLVATSSAGNTVTYTVRSGALPSGLSLAPNGAITGTYNLLTSGSTSVTIRASDGTAFADQSFTILTHGAPVWTTAAGSIGTVQKGQSFTYTFQATDTVPIVSYTYANANTLPNTLSLTSNASSNTGALSGFVNDPNGPLWANAAGSLATVFLSDPVSITLKANTVGMANSITSYSVVGDDRSVLPAGLQLSRAGVISGNAGLYSKDLLETPISRFAPPIWLSPVNLGVAYIGNTISLPLIANSQSGGSTVFYALSSLDILPYGMTLSLNGMLTGTIDKTAVSLEAPVSLPAPVWNTSAGSLGSLANTPISPNATLNAVTLTATPRFGSSIASYAVTGPISYTQSNGVVTEAGVLPEGITLTNAGTLSGSVLPTAAMGETLAALPGPTWASAGFLGNGLGGNAVTLTLNATPPSNATVTNYSVVSGAAPFGTLLSTNSTTGVGTLTGTLYYDASGAVYGKPHRYWQLQNIKPNANGVSLGAWSVFEIEFYDSTGVKIPVLSGGGSQTAPYNISSYPTQNFFDSGSSNPATAASLTTLGAGMPGGTDTLTIDFGSPKAPYTIRFYTREQQYVDQAFLTFTLAYSDDKSAFTTVRPINTQTELGISAWTAQTWYSFALGIPGNGGTGATTGYNFTVRATANTGGYTDQSFTYNTITTT